MGNCTKISKIQYKDLEAIRLESSIIKASFIPNPGGKMVSLVNKQNNSEYLVQKAGEKYKQQPYDGIYVDGECSGFDDMLPAIDGCFYEREPWKGIRVPDHGEVWSLKWDYRVDDGQLHMCVHGIRFPYVLEKNIFFLNDNTLRIDYQLTNLSPFEIDFLWAAHIMVNTGPEDVIMLPEEVEKVNTVLSKSGRMGSYGDSAGWPELISPDGKKIRADVIRGTAAEDMEKYYVKGRLDNGICGIRYSNGSSLKICFPAEKVPHLGVLLNEGAWEGICNVFLEPCTASFDRIDVSRLRGENSCLGPYGKYLWHIDFIID